jgi:oxygen-independent coproporphyrinogen-3 oxidase
VATWRAAGVNRLSLGGQTFDPAALAWMHRTHDGAQTVRAIETARAGGIDDLSLDLIFALPASVPRDWEADVARALALAPTHLSLYGLTVEPGTPLGRWAERGEVTEADEERYAAEFLHAHEALAAAGYEHYEVSAYARPGKRCKHNLNYWQFGDYLGIGPGAHGKLSFPHRVIREMRHKHPDTYLRNAESAGGAALVQEQREVDAADLPFEFMLNALRLTDGFPVTLFQERTGLPLRSIERELDAAEQRGLLTRDHVAIRPTELGQRFLNDLQALFLSDDEN